MKNLPQLQIQLRLIIGLLYHEFIFYVTTAILYFFVDTKLYSNSEPSHKKKLINSYVLRLFVKKF